VTVEVAVGNNPNVTLLLLLTLTLAGLKTTVRPVAGTEEEERVTVSLNPELTTVTVAFAFFPELKVTPDGVNELVKLITLTATLTECVTTPTPPSVPFEPEIVTV
jgi:hypothetical protein